MFELVNNSLTQRQRLTVVLFVMCAVYIVGLMVFGTDKEPTFTNPPAKLEIDSFGQARVTLFPSRESAKLYSVVSDKRGAKNLEDFRVVPGYGQYLYAQGNLHAEKSGFKLQLSGRLPLVVGYLEGFLTADLISQFYAEARQVTEEIYGPEILESIFSYLEKQEQFLIASANSDSWRNLRNLLDQLQGLLIGHNRFCNSAQLKMVDLLFLNAFDQIDDIVQIIVPWKRRSWEHKSTLTPIYKSQNLTSDVTAREVNYEIFKATLGSTSAIQIFPDGSHQGNARVGHVMWSPISSRLRIRKSYFSAIGINAGPSENLPANGKQMNHREVSFFGYPGQVSVTNEITLLPTSHLIIAGSKLLTSSPTLFQKLPFPALSLDFAAVWYATQQARDANHWISVYKNFSTNTAMGGHEYFIMQYKSNDAPVRGFLLQHLPGSRAYITPMNVSLGSCWISNALICSPAHYESQRESLGSSLFSTAGHEVLHEVLPNDQSFAYCSNPKLTYWYANCTHHLPGSPGIAQLVYQSLNTELPVRTVLSNLRSKFRQPLSRHDTVVLWHFETD